jgi:transcriptional regulator with XRE-family HTH domain
VPSGIPFSPETVAHVLELRSHGLSIAAIARLVGASQGTIVNWLNGRIPSRRWLEQRCAACSGLEHADIPTVPYAYLLGIYLGDGYLSVPEPRVYLCIAMDSRYQGIIAECRSTISTVLPHRRSHVRTYDDRNLVIIRSYGREWLCLFPQHGPGRKHRRKIELADWQEEIVAKHPGPLLRGLIHSDGWRGLNRVYVKGKRYAYPRYQFSSRSSDIRGIFTDACDQLGIEWRPWGRWHISVARRESVAKLDEHVGLKY